MNGDLRICRKPAMHPSKWKAIKVVLLTAGASTITWLPFLISRFFYPEVTKNSYAIISSLRNSLPLTFPIFINSILNPLIYAWWHKGFRESIQKICCKRSKTVTEKSMKNDIYDIQVNYSESNREK